MITLLKNSARLFFICALLVSCSRKAQDYSSLISDYKKVLCSTMSSTGDTPKERMQEKLDSIKNECLEALKHLKQEEKEKFNQMISKVELEVAEGNCP